jgi:hypothetical protein
MEGLPSPVSKRPATEANVRRTKGHTMDSKSGYGSRIIWMCRLSALLLTLGLPISRGSLYFLSASSIDGYTVQ